MEVSRVVGEEFLRLPFDQYQRYSVVRAVAAAVRNRLMHPLNVLDVGGLAYSADGSRPVLPIRLCLPDDATVVLDSQDRDVEGCIMGTGENLPFPDGMYDLVVSCDTLEHVSPERRGTFVDELLRVSSNFVVIIAPCASHLNVLAENILDHYITNSLGVEHRQLREHLALGLPECEMMVDLLNRRGLPFVDFDSGYVYNWLTVMLARHYLLSVPNSSKMIAMFDEFYNVALSNDDRRGPGYRHAYLVSKGGDLDLLTEIKREFTREEVGNKVTGAEIFQLAMTLLNMRRTEGADQELWREIAQKEAHIAHLQTLVGERDQVIADLRNALKEYSESLENVQAELERANLEKSVSWRVYSAVSGMLGHTKGTLGNRRNG